MKRYIIPTIIVLVLASGVMGACSSVPSSERKSTQTQTTTELQAQVEALQEELNQLKEQRKAEVIQKAEAYYAIVELLAVPSSGEFKVVTGDEMVKAIVEQLQTSSKLWSLIKATEDPYLMSIGKPDDWGRIQVSYSHVRNYAEEKYRGLMSEYYSQLYINEQLNRLEQARQEAIAQAEKEAKEEAERRAAIDNLPVTYTGKGSGRTPTFWTSSGSSNYQYKLTLTATWSGGISLNWYQEDTSSTGASLIELKTNQVWRTTGISFGFPNEVVAGVTYEYIVNWNKSQKAVYFDIVEVPRNGEWMITVSQVDTPILRPQFGITLVIEYDGEFAYQSTTSNSWGISWRGVLSDNYSREMENIQFPIHFRARKEDGGVSPLVLKIIYEGQVVIEDTAIGEDDEAYVYWEGPR